MHLREHSPFTPSRRHLAGLLAVGALAAPAVALAATSAEPDADLIALGHELEEAFALELAAWNGASDDESEAAEAERETTYERSRDLVHRIEALVATTPAGLMVKSQALVWTHNGERDFTTDVLFGQPAASTDLRLIVAILADLRAMQEGSAGAGR